MFLGFPCGSAGKESARHAGDLDSIPGSARSLGKGKGYPLKYSGPEPWGRKEPDMTEQLSGHSLLGVQETRHLLNSHAPTPAAGACRRRASAAPWCRGGEVPGVARFCGWFRLLFVFYSPSCCFCQRIFGRSNVGVHGGLSRILNSVFSPQLLVSLEQKALR